VKQLDDAQQARLPRDTSGQGNHESLNAAQTRPARTEARRATVVGCEIDRLDFDEAVALCERLIETRGSAQHMAINVAKLIAMREDEQLRRSVLQSELVTADGQAVVWASRLLNDPVPARVAGIDLMHSLFARAELKGYRVYILGAKREVLDRAVTRIRYIYPDLAIVGHRDGYYDESEEELIAADIAAAQPHILFVAMSSPRKEYFLARRRETMKVPFVMGVGGSIDVVAGLRRRAPVILQRLGLEWLFRLLQEPRRLGRRYLTTNTRFVLLVTREFVATRLARPKPTH